MSPNTRGSYQEGEDKGQSRARRWGVISYLSRMTILTEVEKKAFLNRLFTLRQIFSVVVGIAFGMLGVEGSYGVLSYAFGNAIVAVVYTTTIAGIDEELLGGKGVVVQEGYMPSLALFLLVWTLTYSFVIS